MGLLRDRCIVFQCGIAKADADSRATSLGVESRPADLSARSSTGISAVLVSRVSESLLQMLDFQTQNSARWPRAAFFVRSETGSPARRLESCGVAQQPSVCRLDGGVNGEGNVDSLFCVDILCKFGGAMSFATQLQSRECAELLSCIDLPPVRGYHCEHMAQIR